MNKILKLEFDPEGSSAVCAAVAEPQTTSADCTLARLRKGPPRFFAAPHVHSVEPALRAYRRCAS